MTKRTRTDIEKFFNERQEQFYFDFSNERLTNEFMINQAKFETDFMLGAVLFLYSNGQINDEEFALWYEKARTFETKFLKDILIDRKENR